MTSNLGPIAAALISWIAFNTIGKPLLRFFDLRTEVMRTMILYDNVRARWREPPFMARTILRSDRSNGS
jgi:hypothetical protein